MQPLAVPVEEVAQLSGLSISHLNRLRCYQPDHSPPFFKEGRRVLYPVAGVSDWIATRMAATRADLGITS
jgi:predicted DNA-binding transcriptional regulator AlpA